jgi:hypothetical protein
MLTDLTDLIDLTDRLLTNVTKIIHRLHFNKSRLTDLTAYQTDTHP